VEPIAAPDKPPASWWDNFTSIGGLWNTNEASASVRKSGSTEPDVGSVQVVELEAEAVPSSVPLRVASNASKASGSWTLPDSHGLGKGRAPLMATVVEEGPQHRTASLPHLAPERSPRGHAMYNLQPLYSSQGAPPVWLTPAQHWAESTNRLRATSLPIAAQEPHRPSTSKSSIHQDSGYHSSSFDQLGPEDTTTHGSPRSSSDGFRTISVPGPQVSRRVQSMASISSNFHTLEWSESTAVGICDSQVTAIALSDNGKYGASSCRDGVLKVWDPSTAQALGEAKVDDITALRFSPGASILAVRTERALKLYKGWPFTLCRRIPIDGAYSERRPFASDMLFSQDGNRIAVICSKSASGSGGIYLVDTSKDVVFARLDAGFLDHSVITCIAISPDLEWLAGGLDDDRIKTWSLQTYTEKTTLQHTAPYSTSRIVFSKDGLMAASSTSGILRIWDHSGGNVESKNQNCRLLDCAFCPNSDMIATADDSGAVRFFDARTAKRYDDRWVQHADRQPILRITFSPDGAFGASYGYRTLELWHAATGTSVFSSVQINDSRGIQAVFSLDSRILAISNERHVQLLELDSFRHSTYSRRQS
jgi:WD40 repeat protein